MQRLRRRADFLAAAAGAKVHVAGFVLQQRDRRDQDPPRVGYTVSKQVGNAVERNRVRRRLREAVKVSAGNRMEKGRDYVLVGRRAALDLPFDRLVEDLRSALKRVHAGAQTPRRPAQPV